MSEHVGLEAYQARIMLIGKTRTGRVVSVVLADKGEGVYYPVTARNASRKERRYYEQHEGGEKAA